MPLTGRNDKRVLTVGINLRTGRRVFRQASNQRQESFHAFLRQARRQYWHRPIYLLLNGFSSHTTPRSLALARELRIQLIWLPKQHPNSTLEQIGC